MNNDGDFGKPIKDIGTSMTVSEHFNLFSYLLSVLDLSFILIKLYMVVLT
jgi:hypothetical protein